MSARFLCFCPVGSPSETQALWEAMTHHWSRTVEGLLLIDLVPTPGMTAKVPSDDLIARFQNLPPTLFRNYVRQADAKNASLVLEGWPSGKYIAPFIRLIDASFSWVLIRTQSSWNLESLEVLDRCERLYWMATESWQTAHAIQRGMTELASFKFPFEFSRPLLWISETKETSSESFASIVPVFQRLSAHELGARESMTAVESLVKTLLAEPAPLAPRHAASETEAVSVSELELHRIKQELEPLLRDAVRQAGDSAQKTDDLARQTIDRYFAERPRLAANRESRVQLYNRVVEDVIGLGPLERLLRDSEVSEIMVSGTQPIVVEKAGRLSETEARFASDQQLRTVIDRIVAPIGRRVDESSPLCDARLANGSRVNIVLPPLALDGPCLTIRKFMQKRLALSAFVGLDSLSEKMAAFLARCVIERKNLVISGGTGSGKTTLLNALSSLIPDHERIVTIEDAAELQLQKPFVIRLESRPPNAEGQGAIPIRGLVINALRMRPDRIVVGECRGGEALDMLQAMNTGHDGSLTTLHANTPRDALSRLETLVLLSGLELPVRVVREQIRGAVHVIVQQSRLSDGSRKITSITEVTGLEGDTLTTQELFRFSQTGTSASGKITGVFEESGVSSLLRCA